jgi:hypothetical protein
MQSPASISRALYRIVFRRGSPQRIHYDNRLLIWSLIACAIFTLATLRYLYQCSYIEIGLLLFLGLSGLYLAVALLTRRAPRQRLRLALQSVLIILTAAQLLLLLATPIVALLPDSLVPVTVIVGLIAINGIGNCVQFAQSSSRSRALLQTLALVVAIAVLFSILRNLLQTVFG